jgi:hypothetical protein
MMRRENGQVIITITEEEWCELLLSLGYATGSMRKDGSFMWTRALRLVNSINEGNPDYIPYKIPEDPDAH